MENWLDTIEAQYGNSPTIMGMIESFNDALDPTADIDAFYEQIWNVLSANTYGLDVWGKIVGVSRLLQVIPELQFFGFHEAYTGVSPTDPTPFGTGTFNSADNATQVYSLPNEQYRQLILLKAMSNITNGTIPGINLLLRFQFGARGRAYVQKTGTMELTFVFEFFLTNVELAILLNSGAIPRPSGVEVRIEQLNPGLTFGFAEADSFAPFNVGTFFPASGLEDAT
jgi:hypothetical protein